MSEQVTLKQALDHAIAQHQCGNLDIAESIYDELLTHVPDHIDVLHLKGVVANQKQNYKLAIELISKAISLIPEDSKEHPAFSTLHQNLANAYSQDSNTELAEESYKRSLELNAENIDTKYNYSRL